MKLICKDFQVFKANRYFVVSIVSVALLGLSYTVIHANAVASPLAHQVSDQDADQLVGGEFCVTLKKGKCSAYVLIGNQYWRQECPGGKPSNVATHHSCGKREFRGFMPCGGKIPLDEQIRSFDEINVEYLFCGSCVRIVTDPGCIANENRILIPGLPF